MLDLISGKRREAGADELGGVDEVGFAGADLVTASPGAIRTWSVPAGVAFSPDGRHLASSGDDGTARWWKLR